MKKYLILGEFTTGESGTLYGIINAKDKVEALFKIEKYFVENNIASEKIAMLEPIEITDEDDISFVTSTGIANID